MIEDKGSKMNDLHTAFVDNLPAKTHYLTVLYRMFGHCGYMKNVFIPRKERERGALCNTFVPYAKA